MLTALESTLASVSRSSSLITAFTAYFVAQEFAYTAVNRAGLTARAEAGDAGSARALAVTRRTSFMLFGRAAGHHGDRPAGRLSCRAPHRQRVRRS